MLAHQILILGVASDRALHPEDQDPIRVPDIVLIGISPILHPDIMMTTDTTGRGPQPNTTDDRQRSRLTLKVLLLVQERKGLDQGT